MPMRNLVFTVGLVILIISCKNNETASNSNSKASEFECISLLGDTLKPPQLSPEVEKDFYMKLTDTRMEAEAHPKNEIAIIWYGRRLSYMGHFRQAIEVYTKGLEEHPNSFRLLRHRGHRYITLRKFDRAIADLSRAAVLAEGFEPMTEPDGLPNKKNIPLTTTQWNIYYHLGLAHYLNGEFGKALDAYKVCYAQSDNNDILVASSDWLYMIYRRLGQLAHAEEILQKIHPDMDLIENTSYYQRLLMYKGIVSPDSLLITDKDASGTSLTFATQGYGVGNWYYYNNEKDKAISVFEKVVESDNWPAFGYIAAEADLARILEDKN